MKKCAVISLAILLFATVSEAAVRYEFRRMTRSDTQRQTASDVRGRAVIDEDRSRVDFTSGSFYGADSYIVATDGGQKLYIINDKDKSYSFVDIGRSVSSLGSSAIKIENLKTQVTKLEDTPVIAGLPTEHYRMHARYDITVTFGTLPLTQSVETVVDKWVTTAFGEVQANFLAEALPKTGNESIDKLLETETAQVKGLPLRQVITITTASNTVPGRKSQLNRDSTRKQTSELIVSSIEALPGVPKAFFDVPAGYRKVDVPTGAANSTAVVEDLTLEPATN